MQPSDTQAGTSHQIQSQCQVTITIFFFKISTHSSQNLTCILRYMKKYTKNIQKKLENPVTGTSQIRAKETSEDAMTAHSQVGGFVPLSAVVIILWWDLDVTRVTFIPSTVLLPRYGSIFNVVYPTRPSLGFSFFFLFFEIAIILGAD